MALTVPADISPTAATLLRYRTSHWDFLRDCVYTMDQSDKWSPIKKYPTHVDYLHYLADMIVSEPLLALVKSRRMLATWTAVSIFTWDAMFHEGRKMALVSKKDEASDELVERCKFVYDNIPDGTLPVKPVMEARKGPRGGYDEIRFPEIESSIHGYPQGADQLRQYTFSRILFDEIAFWAKARESFVSAKPTLEGGGQFLLVSTRSPGFFQAVVEDKMDGAGGGV